MDEVVIINLTDNKPNEYTKNFIELVTNKISDRKLFPFHLKDRIFDFEEGHLNEIAKFSNDVEFCVHDDRKGATILSSDGSITYIRSKSEVSTYSKINKNIPLVAKEEFDLIVKELTSQVKSIGINESTEKNIETIDRIAQDLSILITDNGNVLVADSYGQVGNICSNKIQKSKEKF